MVIDFEVSKTAIDGLLVLSMKQVSDELEILRVSHEVELAQRQLVADRRRARDQAAVDVALTRMVEAAHSDRNIVPPMLEAVRAEATLGEICDAFRPLWGEYREPVRF